MEDGVLEHENATKKCAVCAYVCVCMCYVVQYGSTAAPPLAREGRVVLPPRHSVYKHDQIAPCGEAGVPNSAH
jgi:hypothetical protein